MGFRGFQAEKKLLFRQNPLNRKGCIRMNPKPYWFVAFIVLLSHTSWAQLTLQGHVFSGKNQEPMPFATVFLAGTTKGTLTDEKGHFTLTNVPSGKFDLIVSFVGFATLKTVVQTQDQKAYRFILKPLENELDAVTVKAHRRGQDWSKQIALFTDNFIGITANASQCRLLNPKALLFEDSPLMLIATAQEPLLIENKALGYRLKFQLEKFSYEYGQQKIAYEGHPLFELMTPKDQQQADTWRENRRKAYQGSVMHFMRALYRKQLVQEGFVIQKVVEKSTRSGERRLIGLPTDTTLFFPSLTNPQKKMGLPMASYKIILDTLKSTPDQPVIAFPGWIQVIYALKREPYTYQRFREISEDKYDIIPQRSFIRMLYPSVSIESSGRFDLQGIFFEGYWTWELMAESLPTDYDPDNE